MLTQLAPVDEHDKGYGLGYKVALKLLAEPKVLFNRRGLVDNGKVGLTALDKV